MIILMVLPSSGTIGQNSIQTEFIYGSGSTISMSTLRKWIGISGTVSFSNFYSKKYQPVNMLRGPGYLTAGGPQLVSLNGTYTMPYQSDGNFVIYKNGSAIWAFQTIGFPYNNYTPNRIYMDPVGYLYMTDGTYVRWYSNAAFLGTNPYRFVLRNDGNAVIYDWNDNIIWQTNSSQGGDIGFIYS